MSSNQIAPNLRSISVAAANVCGNHERCTARIEVSNAVPNFKGPGWEREYDLFFNGEAAAIVDALIHSLPQATVDRVIAELLRRKASLLVVSMEDMAKRGGEQNAE